MLGLILVRLFLLMEVYNPVVLANNTTTDNATTIETTTLPPTTTEATTTTTPVPQPNNRICPGNSGMVDSTRVMAKSAHNYRR
ncbi:hypothetical protein COOONC_07929 [Cooperia oncophora]